MTKRKRFNLILYPTLILAAAVCLFPLIYTVSNSFMGGAEINRYYGTLGIAGSGVNPFHLIPDSISLSGYTAMLLERPHYLMKFWTSLGLCAVIVAGQLVISVLGGFAFAKFRFPFRDGLFFVLIALMMMPYQVMLVPGYMVLDAFGLIGSYAALILPSIFSAFGVFLMRQVFASIPDTIMQSAYLDGAGSWRTLWSVLLPNCKAGAASLVVLSFIDNWNMVEQPLVYLTSSFKYPLSVFLLQVNTQSPALGFACGLLSILPALLLFLFFEDEMISGIGYSVIK